MKPLPKVVERWTQRRAKQRNGLAVRREVRIRDQFCCRSCGKRWTPENPVDVHHLKFRSAGGGDTTDNLLCLCRNCHALVHAYRLFIHGESADGTLRFERVNNESPA